MKNGKRIHAAFYRTGAALFLLALLTGCSGKEDVSSSGGVLASGTETGTGTTDQVPETVPGTDRTPEPVSMENIRLSEVSAMDVQCAPNGIAAGADGTMFVTDIYYKRVWTVSGGTGKVYAGGDTVAGLYGEPVGGYNDADPLSSHFKYPWAIAEFLDGWAVSDTENKVVRIANSQGVRTLNGKAAGSGEESVTFEQPTGLASDEEGNLYVSDTGSGKVSRITPAGIVTTVAEGLEEPTGLCWKDGILYIAETGGNRIRKVEDGQLSTFAGGGEEGMEDGAAAEALFAGPQGVTVGEDGVVYVADTLNSAIRRISGGRVETVTIRDVTLAGFGLISPTGLLAQGKTLYICDSFSRKLYVLEWD